MGLGGVPGQGPFREGTAALVLGAPRDYSFAFFPERPGLAGETGGRGSLLRPTSQLGQRRARVCPGAGTRVPVGQGGHSRFLAESGLGQLASHQQSHSAAHVQSCFPDTTRMRLGIKTGSSSNTRKGLVARREPPPRTWPRPPPAGGLPASPSPARCPPPALHLPVSSTPGPPRLLSIPLWDPQLHRCLPRRAREVGTGQGAHRTPLQHLCQLKMGGCAG